MGGMRGDCERWYYEAMDWGAEGEKERFLKES